jgi:hypothetical protein
VNNGFKKPSKRKLYRRFLYIDGNEVRIMLYG